MELYGLTDVGLVRKNNQDSYAFRLLDNDFAIAVVCDGMGGARAGNIASAVAVEVFTAALEEACKAGLPPDSERKHALMRGACKTANERVLELAHSHDEYEGMGTTLVAAMILSNEAYVANIGDSRCYLLSDGVIRQITLDHSLVQALVTRGDITQEEARFHPKKNLITRAIGIDPAVRCDVFRIDCKRGDKLLLCSDGLSNVVADDVLQATLAQDHAPERLARTLLELAVEQGAPDNVTVVLAQL